MTIGIKRVYDEVSDHDGYRVLVDRLWPRGITKERAHLDAWLKDVAPSPGLRMWWNHDSERLEEFATRYRAELDGAPESVRAIAELRALGTRSATTITLVYGAKDPQINHARILAEYLANDPGT
ncbi:DUF488 domain-containing protein [Cryobacterium sp. HLT2-28]|uniref:DUF488 domain-containing protein n=1 Tax=Cryobacterium sp. HLT2-28 TaxID=1259146 RepID=UPI0010696495|nr:DUF488 family protein [Cryobacterium sp. HLT2-28]TFB94969.1 DUF488 family protein [Cryobacterium sp. HLT2-28]